MTVVSRSWRRDASWIILRKLFLYLLSGLGSCFSCGSLGPACLWRFYPSHPYCGRTLSDRKHQGDLVIHFVQPMGQQSDSNGNTTSKPDSTGAVQYAWDFENRLIDVTLPGNVATISRASEPPAYCTGIGKPHV